MGIATLVNGSLVPPTNFRAEDAVQRLCLAKECEPGGERGAKG
jgi:hypothetical protein